MSPNTSATKYKEYFFPDGDIIIRVSQYSALPMLNKPCPQVENSIFKIDRHHLTRYSTHFKTLINPSVPVRGDPPGSSESNPFVVDDATSEEFANFLWVFYNPCATILFCFLSINKLIYVKATFLTKPPWKNGSRS